MEVKQVLIKNLHFAKYNPRKISEPQRNALKASLLRFGFVDPAVVNVNGNVIIGGHQRIRAWSDLGNETAPCVFVDLDPAAEMALNLALNKTGGEFDHSLLKSVLQDLKDWQFPDFECTGFNDLEIKDLLIPEIEPIPAGIDSNDIPEIPSESKTKLGDLYEIGPHRLLCGSSIIRSDIDRLMGDNKADMVFTDPPYNVAYVGKTKDAKTIQNDAMENEDFYNFLYSFYTNALFFTKEGGPIYIAHGDNEGVNFRIAMINAGWELKQCIIWVKNTIVMGRKDYHYQHEPILYGWKPGSAHKWYGQRNKSTVWNFNKPQRNAEHPTMKPVELVEQAIMNSSKKGDLILDSFGGSGTTMVASHLLGRKGFLIEIDPVYCDVIVNRMAILFPSLPVLLNGKPFKTGP